MMSASTASSCSGLRTSIGWAPSSRSICRCSRKSPWRPRTPTRSVAVTLLPAADGEAFTLGDGLERDAGHWLAEAARDVGDELRVGVVSRRLDDGLRAPSRIGRLVDAGTDKVAFGAELHGERGIRRRCDAASAEEHDGELLFLGDVLHEL